MLAFRRFIVALIITGLVFGGYALAIAPWLEPPAVPVAKGTGKLPGHYKSSLTLRDFDDLFEDGAWELDDPKVIETATCTLLLKDYRPLPDGRMEINPCTLIFYLAPTRDALAAAAKNKGKDPLRRRVVLRALQGAVLNFDRPLDLGKAEFGQLVGGQLKGAIQIFSPPTEPGGNDALQMATKGVQIERQKIYTPHEVDFRYGASFGRGRDLTITLLPQDTSEKGRVRSLGGVSYLQLSQLERLHLEGTAALMQGPAGAKAKQAEPPLEVHCQGPLIVDFDNQQARLDDHVEITRVYQQGPPDKLTCDRLLFRLAGKSAASAPKVTPTQGRASATPKGRGAQGKLAGTVERIIAVGTPAIIDAPQSGVYAKAASMDYTLATQVVRMQNGPTGAPVILRQNKNRFEARAIEYESAEPGRLGKLFAAGPGELELVQENGQAVQATWKKLLHIRPHEGSQAISVWEDAHVSAGPLGTFDASELHLWVQEVARPAKVEQRDASAKNPASKKAPFSLVPERLLALGAVEIDTPQLQAKTQELQAWFVDATPRQLAEAAASGPKPLPGIPKPREQGQVPAVEGAEGATGQPTQPHQKLGVSGKLVKLQILRLAGKPAVEDLAITGEVLVEEIQTERPQDAPLKLTGEAVTLVSGSGPSAKLEVKGRPAQVSARGLTLSGATIHLHRGENRLWIDGPGEAELPVPADGLQMRSLQPPPGEAPATAPADLQAAGTAKGARRVKVTWADGMSFDGLKASFEGKVRARGEAEYASGESLHVTLSERIDFSGARRAGTAEIARLVLQGGKSPVTLQQITYGENGEQASLDNLRTGTLTIDRQAGTLTAEGPGEVWTVRKDSGGLLPGAPAGGGPNGGAPNGIAPPLPKDGKLSYICVKFEGGISGKLDKHEIRFERQVDTTYGRVNDWKERVFATKSEDLGPSGAHMTSDALTVTEMALTRAQKWVELEATGNVIVDGQSFTARASRIGYTSDKETLVLEGDGRSDAEFWHQAAPGAQHSYTSAGKITFRRPNSLEVGGGKSLTLGSLPPSNKPLPIRRR